MLGGSKHRPHPEEHRTEVGLAGLRQLKKGRNRQQPISIAMRLEGWRESRNVSEKLAINGTSQCLGRSFETAAQERGLLRMRSVGIVGKLDTFTRRLGAAPPLLNLQRLGDATQA